MQSTTSVVVDRPLAEVFLYTNERVAEWSKTVTRIEPLGAKEHGVGARSRVHTEDAGREMEFDCVVTVWDPPNASAVEMTGKQFDITAHYTFVDLGDRTEVTQRSTVRGKGAFRALFFLLGWLMKKQACRAQESELENLKRLLEAGAADRAQA